MTTKEFKVQYALGTLSIAQKLKAARNVQTSRRVLTILGGDSNWNIRLNVWANPNTPKQVTNMIWFHDRDRIDPWRRKYIE